MKYRKKKDLFEILLVAAAFKASVREVGAGVRRYL